MEYIKIKNAEDIIKKSNYLVTNPKNFKNKWKDVSKIITLYVLKLVWVEVILLLIWLKLTLIKTL